MDWGDMVRDRTDLQPVLDIYTMRAVEKSLRARAMSHPYAANGRPWKLGADHVKDMITEAVEDLIEKGKS
jgi:hypothetical protein